MNTSLEQTLLETNAGLEKALTAKNRELEIEASLEKVRIVAMNMQKSEDLISVCKAMFTELNSLGFTNIRNAQIAIKNDEKQCYTLYVHSDFEEVSGVEADYSSHPEGLKLYQQLGKSADDFYEGAFTRVEMEEWRNWRRSLSPLRDPREETADSMCWYLYAIGRGHIGISTFNSITEEQIEIVKRFKNVFELSYRRFDDLQKAEAQAREAQIEAAMERVRARTMVMQHSNELAEAASLLFKQIADLGTKQWASGFDIWQADEVSATAWMSNPDGSVANPFIIPYTEDPFHQQIYEARQSGKDLFVIESDGKELEETYKYMFTVPDAKKYFDAIISIGFQIPTFQITHCAFFSQGYLMFITYEPVPEMWDIFKRFAKVFEQTYTRFLDLQKAEAQAREAQIEAALERVRSRSLAMHHSDELKEVMVVILRQLQELGISMVKKSAIMLLFEEGVKDFIQLVASPEHAAPLRLATPYFDHVMMKDIWETREKGINFSSITLTKEEKDHFFSYFYEHTAPLTPEEEKKWQFESEHYTFAYAVQKHSGIGIANFTDIPLSENENEIIRRFSGVFEQSYIRFLDLQKAEAQAREAQIEAALERVRSRSLAMQKSEDLKEIVTIVLEQFQRLGFEMEGGAVHIQTFNEASQEGIQWSADPLLQVVASFKVPYNDNPVFADFLRAKHAGESFFFHKYSFEEKNKWFDWAFEHTDFKNLPDEFKKILKGCESYAHWAAIQKNSAILVNNILGKSLPEDQIDLLKRFSTVFEQSYIRFLDLQKAEANAKEAIKRAALDRIRADIASMRTTKDLERITPLIWNELTILGVPFIRCGVFIMDEAEQLIHTFLSTPDGKAITAFHLPYATPGNISFVLKNWRNHKNYIDHWDERNFTEFANSLVKQGALSSANEYMKTLPAGGFYLHFLPFQQGMLYVGNNDQLNEEQINVVQSVADAFATAYARYEDFNKLEVAKKQVESTLQELKSAQKQLIQSEKMASMGELTAGIAHEIQNPLNFVNNFSEVNTELLGELKAERLKPKVERDEEAEDGIINDVIANEEKIIHHGKRADAIVKSMLQHSRISSGKKEPTNINALADEYFRLSYHGMRAKDKSFNATMKTDFDESVGRINVVPQDIGRVFLNLFNNAFYACAERSRSSTGSDTGSSTDAERSRSASMQEYTPTVWVSTKRIMGDSSPPEAGRPGGAVEIRVRDNGNGIPEKIKDKIFQPFFTTKPTGEGTGLGLSLSYDMVKAHGGEISVNSKEGEARPDDPVGRGTEFVVMLPA